MKGFKIFLSGLLLPFALSATVVNAAPVQKRTASHRQTATVQTNPRNTSTRSVNTRNKGNTKTQTPKTSRTSPTTQQTRSTISRQQASTATRATRTTTQSVHAQKTTQQRSALPTRLSSRTAQATTIARNTTEPATADKVLARNYAKCREVFNSCMDEFCANKDTTLKRCACSARYKEFDGMNATLTTIEDKLLDFGQRLLTVNMDKEDALAINQATEGEIAYNTQDTSSSKKLLDEISKKLNTSFNDSNFDQSLNSISLSLNMDAAFDDVDSLAGASATTKIGTALHSAALPVCREMAAEVCTPDEVKIAENAYKMIIEQDCNTVAKTYQTQIDQAHAKVLESGALLDMSRLDIHQKRNSDDLLTCKSKMLEKLTDSTVCGTDLHKCLDTTGKFVDPTTGKAILSQDLYLLSTTLVRPTGDTKWQTVPKNTKFVTYLNTKREYLKPTMENCQNVADTVWNEFLNDALAKIKLAQDAKLEEVRQSCTKLTAECISNAAQTIEDFDARALSVFAISADKTANEMCTDVKNSCSALLDSMGATEWNDGIDEIVTENTYSSILQTCRIVGENCIVDTCQTSTGKFELCLTDYSMTRANILTRAACWNKVTECVNSAGDDALATIQKQYSLGNNLNDFYNQIYVEAPDDDAQACPDQCKNKNPDNNIECYKCLLAEKIWGNCKYDALTTPEDQNNILQPKNSEENLLTWFADSTNNQSCDMTNINCSSFFEIYGNHTNCCGNTLVSHDDIKICCQNAVKPNNSIGSFEKEFTQGGNTTTSNIPLGNYGEAPKITNNICAPTTNANLMYVTNSGDHVYCAGNLASDGTKGILKCDGKIFSINENTYKYKTLQQGGWCNGVRCGEFKSPPDVFYKTKNKSICYVDTSNMKPDSTEAGCANEPDVTVSGYHIEFE